MRDSNLPKFLPFDIPLFNAILKDLFPKSILPEQSNAELDAVCKAVLEEAGMVDLPSLKAKILQLHETLKVRFGVMVVGETMSGKSTALKTLQKSYCQLKEAYLAR